jgi:ribonuclease-3
VQPSSYLSLTRKLGYEFRDQKLLKLALTHRSFGSTNNERLEFLGDSILNLIIGEALFKKFPEAKEGQLSRLRSALVRGDTLFLLAREFELNRYLILGEGELKSGGLERASILSDTVEALIGAIYSESGFDICRERVLEWYGDKLSSMSLNVSHTDAKTRLQEYLQSRKLPLPDYQVVEVTGESHAQTFVVECQVALLERPTRATATSRREAEKLAASEVLRILKL